MTQETSISNEALQAREETFWREELDWVRRHPHPDLTTFNAAVEKEKTRSGVGELPPLDIAMRPENVRCDIDVSDPNKFNDRFIELPVESRSHWVEQFFWCMHHLGLIIAIASAFSSKKPIFIFFAVYLFTGLFWGPFIYGLTFYAGKKKVGRTRYNRQAQLVHVAGGDGRVAHIPWRHVRPLMSTGVSPPSILLLCAPRPFAEQRYEGLLTAINPKRKTYDQLMGLTAFLQHCITSTMLHSGRICNDWSFIGAIWKMGSKPFNLTLAQLPKTCSSRHRRIRQKTSSNAVVS